MKLNRLIGLSGVSVTETYVAQKVGSIFKWLSIVVITLLALQWNLELKGQMPAALSRITNYFVFSFFLLETIILGSLVKETAYYIKNNWMNIFIVCSGFLLILGPFLNFNVASYVHPLIAFILLLPWIASLRLALTDNRLGTTLAAALIIILFSGIVISAIDPQIPSPVDGIWWAWVTVSTVGYGDFVPTTLLGKVFGCGLILMGLALFSVITANFSALFIQRGFIGDELKKEEIEIGELLRDVAQIKQQQQDLLVQLAKIEAKIG